ncbi:MAG TPA: helix-hairpin-helix domain-containing protein, partial [Puia sp.]|nr:helix-hairpin-helix domain-containing protein [Puia sp.]
MTISNDHIADQFSLLAKLMDIHGENSFKTKSYSVAAFTLEKLPQPIQSLPPDKFTSIKGIGDAIGKKIQEILETGELRLLHEYINKTPPGVIAMLQIKGLGPKKISTIWKEIEIESIGELLYACQENRLLLYKGFGEKTQQNVRDAIEFLLKNQGSHLYAEVEAYVQTLHSRLQQQFPAEQLALTGDFRRQLEIIDKLQWVTTATPTAIQPFFEKEGLTLQTDGTYKGTEGVHIEIIHTAADNFITTLFETSCSGEFLEAWRKRTSANGASTSATSASSTNKAAATSAPSSPTGAADTTASNNTSAADSAEAALFAAANISYIPPFRREQSAILDRAANAPLPAVLQPSDIKAIIHSHSTWSDGSNTLEEMAAACIEKGFEYLVISDHSRSAFYANGLKEDRIREQHAQIDELNKKLAPFTIFKSIECDILNDGALDYTDDILSTFDLVITSIHSNLKMSEEKAMTRLLRAIENPYTTILGHMTGRLLLSRPGYPVDHKAIIDACVRHKVAIELNAHPRRLDMDWRWITYALDHGALISIDPDAHS